MSLVSVQVAAPGVIRVHSQADEGLKGSMRRTFSKNGLEDTWDFYQETQGPKTLESMPDAERQVHKFNILPISTRMIRTSS